ncbi:hypothetical protein L211DRAFT_770070, partial [Terfezia boudieri ATCC MYA-4762]
VDLVSVAEERFVLIVEAKRSSLGQAMKQCLLAMKDMRDNNGEGEVYGFVTTGESWQVVIYDGVTFQLSGKVDLVFPWMGQAKQKWMKECGIIVDCINMALTNGGGVKK